MGRETLVGRNNDAKREVRKREVIPIPPRRRGRAWGSL